MKEHRRNIPPLRLATFERFWTKVDKTPGLGPNGDCWEWRGATIRGYGNIGWSIDGKTQTFLAHRVAWFVVTGKQPGEVMCHKCDNPLCVRPEHLWSGTHVENMLDRDGKGRTAFGDRSGGDKRRGANNGRHTHPESTVRGERWHQAHTDESRERARQSQKRFYREHPENRRGERNGRSKLTEDEVRAIRACYRAGGVTMRALGARYGVSKTVVQHIMSGRLWSHVLDESVA
jgi:hypothetical protein